MHFNGKPAREVVFPEHMTRGEQNMRGPRKAWLKTFWKQLGPIVVGIVIALGLKQWVVYGAEVPTQSMEPTIPAPSYILVNKLQTEFSSLYRGEVVVFHYPDNPSELFVKRIIGMPGDTVTVTDHHIYINGKLFEEPYIHLPNQSGLGTYDVPSGHYFMMGDNRPVSLDSRFWTHKYVARAAIVGQAQFVVYPFSESKSIIQ